MKKSTWKNIYQASAIFAILSLMAVIYISVSLSGDPFDTVKEMRTYVTDDKLLAVRDTEEGILLYSAGKVNDGKDEMYFVDMVKKSFWGTRWTGGGGHTNRDIGNQEGRFILSAQLLNEDQSITPTLFGIITDNQIEKVSVLTKEGSKDSVVYDGINPGEEMYVVQFEQNVSDYPLFIIVIQRKDGKKLNYVISGDEIDAFQEGRPIYIYEDQLEWKQCSRT